MPLYICAYVQMCCFLVFSCGFSYTKLSAFSWVLTILYCASWLMPQCLLLLWCIAACSIFMYIFGWMEPCALYPLPTMFLRGKLTIFLTIILCSKCIWSNRWRWTVFKKWNRRVVTIRWRHRYMRSRYYINVLFCVFCLSASQCLEFWLLRTRIVQPRLWSFILALTLPPAV